MLKPITAALALIAGLAAPALAEDAADTPRVANGQRFGAWTVTCEAVAVNETACVLGQRLLRNSDQAFLAQMIAFTSADGEKNFLAARVPVGAYLPSGFVLKADGAEEQVEFTWQSCSRDLCEALIELDEEKLAQLNTSKAIASYRPNLRAEPVVFQLSLEGAPAGLDAMAKAKKAKAE